MPVRRVIKMGHPLLREVARPVEPHEIAGDYMKQLLPDMVETLNDYGGIGLAAPQIAEPVRLAIIEIPGGQTRYGELAAMPLTVFINPVIEIVDPAPAGYWEGCLSVPGLRGFVERPQHVKITYTTERAEAKELELTGFAATVFQHELDHLDGKLFVDRMTDMKLLAFEEEYEKYLVPRED